MRRNPIKKADHELPFHWGCRANSDLNLYSEYTASLHQKSLAPYFAALRAVSQLYLVDSLCTRAAGDKARLARARDLAALISDTENRNNSNSNNSNNVAAGVFRVEEVYEFAERRADWVFVRKDVERAMYGLCIVM